jgi:hypothetical protein
VYLTAAYDLERWVGDDRTKAAVPPFFPKEMRQRRGGPRLPVVCRDRWAP